MCVVCVCVSFMTCYYFSLTLTWQLYLFGKKKKSGIICFSNFQRELSWLHGVGASLSGARKLRLHTELCARQGNTSLELYSTKALLLLNACDFN